MHQKLKPTLIILFAGLLSASAFADDLSGKTSNGCSYKIINGQYLYDCSSTNKAPAAPKPNSSDYTAVQTPVISPPLLSFPANPPAEQSKVVASDEERESSNNRSSGKWKNNSSRDRFYDATYFGAHIGGSTITAANAGSSTGAGISIGTNLDDFLGIELGYSYTKLDMNMNLASRSSSGAPSPSPINTDSSLSAHLLSAEIQFHLTDTFKRLRPYGGIGLGWKHSTLTDNGTAATIYSSNAGGGSLSQNSIGAVASLGTKFRFSDTWNAALAFRYYLPVSNQVATLDTAAQSDTTGTGNRLSQADRGLTSSSLYQLVGGVQYAF